MSLSEAVNWGSIYFLSGLMEASSSCSFLIYRADAGEQRGAAPSLFDSTVNKEMCCVRGIHTHSWLAAGPMLWEQAFMRVKVTVDREKWSVSACSCCIKRMGGYFWHNKPGLEPSVQWPDSSWNYTVPSFLLFRLHTLWLVDKHPAGTTQGLKTH